MNYHASRRDILKGGGALTVAFAFGGPVADALAQGAAAAKPLALTEVDASLDRLRTILILAALSGIGLAALLGLLVARTALAPVRRLTEATEEVTETRDLSRPMADEGTDELGRLAASFNTMLAALEDSALSQRRFVADASHELRTPLTSLRTNIEVLARNDAMPLEERERLLADVVEQLGARDELARAAREVLEHRELARGQLDGLARARHRVACRIDDELPHRQPRRPLRRPAADQRA